MGVAERTAVQQAGSITGHDGTAGGQRAAAGGRRARSLIGRDWLPRRITLRTSPLTRRIITFNLIALNILTAGILFLNASRESLVKQHASALIGEAELIANVFEGQLRARGAINLSETGSEAVSATLGSLRLRNGIEVYVFDVHGGLLGQTEGIGQSHALTALAPVRARKTPISEALTLVWSRAEALFAAQPAGDAQPLEARLRSLVPAAIRNETQVDTGLDAAGGSVFSAMTTIRLDGVPTGVVAVTTPAGEIDAVVRGERERVLQMFLVAALVSVGLSLVLASAIANPLADLAEAAEAGRDRGARKVRPARVRIPDLSARHDEIGRLSRAMRGMVSALYARIDANEQFAADVAHEIKNPLASLRSAVGTLRMVQRADQRDRLLHVIEHDVRRLDRLVSDISNASRLDAEL
ncbi:MAG: sensor N-terminal transmembrane domain-containing protein, partial [Planctomycetes bacterium]|nr:sensor N-terminal transmembrane domain-containing protein [Planctomycetota bacterium]